jgi:hypothetical protein
LHGRASFAGPVSGGEGFAGTREEFDVFRVGASRGTRRQTEDTCGPDGGKEQTIVRGIFEKEGSLHFGSWRQLDHAGIIGMMELASPPEKRH